MDLQEPLGLSWQELEEIHQKAFAVKVSPLEKLLVNVFTPLDLTLRPCFSYLAQPVRSQLIGKLEETRFGLFLSYFFSPPTLPFLERAGEMWEGKIRDYQSLVLISQRNGESLPAPVKWAYQSSPCGLMELLALYWRNSL